MFRSAEHKTLGARVGEIGFTVFLMWFGMLLVVGFFQKTGMMPGDFSKNVPILGTIVNYWLQSNHTTLAESLNSPLAVAGVLGAVLFAPLVEEIIFRWLFCRGWASDHEGNILPHGKGLGIILAGSFIAFGLAHGHGYFSVMLQGVGGLWLARLWFRNGPNHWSSYFSCVAAHSLYNISVITTVWLMS